MLGSKIVRVDIYIVTPRFFHENPTYSKVLIGPSRMIFWALSCIKSSVVLPQGTAVKERLIVALRQMILESFNSVFCVDQPLLELISSVGFNNLTVHGITYSNGTFGIP